MMFVLGMIWPDIFWSTHFIAFLPSIVQYAILIVTALVILYAYKNEKGGLNLHFTLNIKNIIIISILTGIAFYNLNIINDYYGDAKNFNPFLNQRVLVLRDGFWKELFSIRFKTGHARWGVFNLYSLIAYILKIDMYQTFRLMDAFFGSGFVFIWLSAINKYSKNVNASLILIVLGCTAPVVLNFCGHIETYGLILFLLMSWVYVFVSAIKEKNKYHFWLLIPLFIICLRFNTPSIFLLPALVSAFIYYLFKDNPRLNNLFTLKNTIQYVLIPLIIIGLFAYFFILGDYNDSRILDNNTNDIDRLFLPLLSPESPLDTYNLLSWNHISDFFMSFYFWSPGLLFLVGIILINRKKITWNTPIISILLLTILLYLGFLFMINPLMSLPMDWDLYTLPFPFVLMLLLLILQNHSRVIIKKNTIIYILGLQLLVIPYFVVLMNKTMHSYRIESIGVRVYKTYYQHADSYLLYALQMLEGKELYSLRKTQLLDKLKPFTRGIIDSNYAALLLDEAIYAHADKNYIKSRELLLLAESYNPNFNLTKEYLELVNNELLRTQFIISEKDINKADKLISEGLYFLRDKKFYNKALYSFKRAYYYNPLDLNINLFQMEAYFLKNDFNNALKIAERLADLKFPDQKQAYRFVIHCSLEAGFYDKAKEYSETYLNFWPEDHFIETIYNELINNENISELKYKFARIK